MRDIFNLMDKNANIVGENYIVGIDSYGIIRYSAKIEEQNNFFNGIGKLYLIHLHLDDGALVDYQDFTQSIEPKNGCPMNLKYGILESWKLKEICDSISYNTDTSDTTEQLRELNYNLFKQKKCLSAKLESLLEGDRLKRENERLVADIENLKAKIANFNKKENETTD